ncbi:hybrid sensor histidine kinase/response regulator [Jannaschia ovalis]|uniref:histidine kinase n=1 Tax=Jannaschia ovalis TaxID=3038773 RepID=A0ABY8LA40_9RHOB|nr:ATP-binding protein [Jannaschia sp. GRR-S6-38]WGH78154.1 response regulator [Jannaschia sp. GRR-S6-38]
MTRDPDSRDLLAHDIRAAMSDVIGGLRLIEGTPLPEAVRGQLDRIQSASELLARLVETLLTGGPEDAAASLGNLNLPRFLDAELRRWHGAAAPMGTRVRLDRSEDLPQVVRLNGLHLRRVVANLMGNALRHAPGGTITLGAGIDGDGQLSIRVTDAGPGFPQALLDDPFQVDAAAGPGRGTGMGLQIAAAHAEALGGRIALRNRPEGGAEVALSVPRAVWERDSAADAALPDLRGARILVADDSLTVRTLLAGMISRLGAECETARDGIEALNWLSRERFDLALIDIEMPVLGGLEVLRSERLRQAWGVAPPTSMVAITAHGLEDSAEAIREAGADGTIPKPLPGIESFARSLAHFLSAAPDPSNWRPERAAPLSAVTLSELMHAAGPDHAAALLAGLRADLERVERELGRALAAGRRDEIAAQTHVLLSLVGAVGALPTQEAARRLNRLADDGGAEAVQIAGKVCLGRLSDLRAELDAAG